MAITRNSGSKSETWEGIEGYKPQFIQKSELKTDLHAIRDKQNPTMMDKQEFASKYGFIFGDQVDKIFQDANTAKFDEIDGLTRKARDTSLTDMAAGHDQYLSTLREQRANAPQSGIMKGANMAAELQSQFGSQSASSEAQQGYASSMAKLANERGSSAEEARVNAMKEKNMVANQMGTLATEKYGMDVQNEASYLSYLAQENANIGNLLQASGVWNQAEGQNTRRKTSESTSFDNLYDDSAEVNAGAQKYVADQNLIGNKYTADSNLTGSKYNADQNFAGTKYSSDQNLAGSKYNADQNLIGTKYSSDKNYAGTQYSADQNLAGSKYNADKNFAGTQYSADKNSASSKYAADSNAASQRAATAANSAYQAKQSQAYSSSGSSSSQANQGAFNQAYDSYLKQGYSPEAATQMALGLAVGTPQAKAPIPTVRPDITTTQPRPTSKPTAKPVATYQPVVQPKPAPKPSTPIMNKQPKAWDPYGMSPQKR